MKPWQKIKRNAMHTVTSMYYYQSHFVPGILVLPLGEKCPVFQLFYHPQVWWEGGETGDSNEVCQPANGRQWSHECQANAGTVTNQAWAESREQPVNSSTRRLLGRYDCETHGSNSPPRHCVLLVLVVWWVLLGLWVFMYTLKPHTQIYSSTASV